MYYGSPHKTLWTHYSQFFFSVPFLFLFFNFTLTRPNCRPIQVNLLGQDQIKRHETKMNKVKEMVGFFKLQENCSLYSSYFQNYIYCVSSILGWRKKRRSHWILIIKREKSALTPILTTKIVNLGVNRFQLVRRVLFRCFFIFNLPKKPHLTSRIFQFQVDFGFLCGF